MPVLPKEQVLLKAYDPHTNGGQYLEDLSTAYWLSDALFTALEMDIFETIHVFGSQGATSGELSQTLCSNEAAVGRYLELLRSLGLLERYQEFYTNSLLTQDYLLKESPLYQGDSILWRKNLIADWNTLKASLQSGGRVNFLSEDTSEDELDNRREKYIKAMDNIAKLKASECVTFFSSLSGEILDVGTGSGAMALAFLDKFPDTRATLLDIRQVLPQTKKIIEKTPFSDRVDYHPGNILEPEWGLTKKYQLIILSNIVHAYAEAENELVLSTATKHLTDDGILLIHDFFNEHCPVKAHLSDVNMLLNTYNGKVFSGAWVIDTLRKSGLSTTPLIPLETDTALIFGTKSSSLIENLAITPIQKLIHPIREMGFHDVFEISPDSVVITDFAKNKCRFGCSSYDKKHCESNDISLDETRSLISSYSKALLLKGEPPTGDFQHKILAAEKLAFTAGFHKAFSFWAGPCAICPKCDLDKPCKNTKNRRPSMEGSGIDVFETVRGNGETLETRSAKDQIVKYYGLLLLE
ncbi:methyltransferase [Acetobacterium tundrae]|uniref:Methyltransferase n=1 Tax=Acetobacterium tundrae TaxID=132932 RepID=A0ABR6WHP3_9FIRM|nr:methyltransferase [Acetobacterium tundrae]